MGSGAQVIAWQALGAPGIAVEATEQIPAARSIAAEAVTEMIWPGLSLPRDGILAPRERDDMTQWYHVSPASWRLETRLAVSGRLTDLHFQISLTRLDQQRRKLLIERLTPPA